ncbi:MAG: hypothetical protein ABI740_07350 [Alphaproteobacteria bacterium]
MNLSIRILGWVHLVTGGIGLAIGLAACIGIGADPTYRHTLAYLVPFFMMLACFWFLPATVGGWGLLTGKPWGRWIIWALSALMLPLIPVGTVLGGAGVWVLYSTRDRNGDNFGPAMLAARASGRRYLGLALAMLAAVAILAGMIGVGYLFRHQIEGGRPKPPLSVVPPMPLLAPAR